MNYFFRVLIICFFIWKPFDILAQNIRANLVQRISYMGEKVDQAVGNVVYGQGDAVIYCDSAIAFDDGRIRCFGKVKVKKSNKFDIYSDYLTYSSNSKKGEFRRNVKMVDKTKTLTCDNLDFDMGDNSGHFYGKSHLVDTAMDMTCVEGYFYNSKNTIRFLRNVVVKHKRFDMTTDTMDFDQVTEKSLFYGKTKIVDSLRTITCKRGWFISKAEAAEFQRNVKYVSKNQIITGNVLAYDKSTGIGKALGNAEIIDTSEHIVLRGNYIYFDEKKDSAFMTDKALVIQVFKKDSLYLHGDTIISIPDSTKKFKNIKCFHHVKLFKPDFQGKCDSLYYTFKDSIIHLFGKPVMWNLENQITGKNITIFTKKNRPAVMDIKQSAFLVSKEDSGRFNQISGKDMKGLFKDGSLYRLDVLANGQAIYYAKDKGTIIGMNRLDSEKMKILIENNKVKKLKCPNSTKGTLFPLKDLTSNDQKLDGFIWYENVRPIKWSDVFIWEKK